MQLLFTFRRILQIMEAEKNPEPEVGLREHYTPHMELHSADNAVRKCISLPT
jgi:hypothetical protein